MAEKETKKIVSKLCYKANERIQLFGQHDIRLLNDHKFSVFNNNAFFKKENIKDKKSQIAIISLDDQFNLLNDKHYFMYNVPHSNISPFIAVNVWVRNK